MERVFKRDGILFKILPCLLITMYAFMVLYGSFVYADNSLNSSNDNYFYDLTGLHFNEVSNNDTTLSDFMSEYNLSDMIVFKYNTEDYYWFYFTPSNEYFVFDSYEDGFSTSNSGFPYANYFIDTNSNDRELKLRTSANSRISNSTVSVVYSSYDVFDTNGNVVFQAPPQEQIQATSLVVAPQVEGVQMNKVLQEILGILPVILLVIVGLLAIRKGIQMIMAFLRKS